MDVTQRSRRAILTAAASAAGLLGCGASFAQSDVVKVIVPFPPGGTADPLARAVAERIRAKVGKQVIVENRSGASSIIGTEALARSAPDGMTIGMVAGPFVLNPSLRAKLPYNTLKDFAPITRYVRMPQVLAVNPSLPVKNVKEFVAYAKAHPEKVSMAVAAPGTFGDIAAHQFKKNEGLDLPIVPYKGGGQAVQDLLGGQVTSMIETLGTVHQHAIAGKLRIIAALSASRIAVLPDVETMAEAGYRDFEYSAFFGWVAPAGTPEAKVNAFADAINDLSISEKAALVAQGFELVPDTPKQFAASLRAEIERWSKAIKELGISTSV